jgi:hypothetical protein
MLAQLNTTISLHSKKEERFSLAFFPARHPATYVTVELSARNGTVPCLSTAMDSYKQSSLSSTIYIIYIQKKI